MGQGADWLGYALQSLTPAGYAFRRRPAKLGCFGFTVPKKSLVAW